MNHINKLWVTQYDAGVQDGYCKKDVIKVGGFQVWPNEIEAVINEYPKVREVAVAGVKDEMGAEVGKA